MILPEDFERKGWQGGCVSLNVWRKLCVCHLSVSRDGVHVEEEPGVQHCHLGGNLLFILHHQDSTIWL